MITSGDGPGGCHGDLIDLLKDLRRRQGGPSLRKISAAAAVSHGYLSGVLTGKELPAPQTAVAIARALGATSAEQTRARLYAERAAADRSAARGGGVGDGPGSTAVLGQVLDAVHGLRARPARPVVWPVRVGVVPVMASAFRDRACLRDQVTAARARTDGVVLTQVLAGGGGVGKTQLAASYAAQAVTDGVDLVVWVDATAADAIPAAYAQAAARVDAPGADGADADHDARAFLDWLATTSRSWLIVLDDITDPQQIAAWWPSSHTGTGWVLGTTRRRDATLSGGGRAVVEVDVYTEQEAAGYLTDRLTEGTAAHLLDDAVGPLAAALGHLPLALSHSAAYMINEDLTCAEYLDLYTDRRSRLDQAMPATADTEHYGRPVAITLLLAVGAAQAADPPGLALPALRLAAMLDPAGHPDAIWTNPAVTDYLVTHRTTDTDVNGEVTATSGRATLRLLHRYALVTHTSTAGSRAVRMHAVTARAAREATPTDRLPATVQAAADALMAIWPQHLHPDRDPDLVTALRANTDILAAHAGDLLWNPGGHPVLNRAGESLLHAGLHAAAITHWQRLTADSTRLLGPEHPDTLKAWSNLGISYRGMGRTDEAITVLEQVTADALRLLGPKHPNTLVAWSNLAASYYEAGRTGEAITIQEQVAVDRARLLGPDHPDTLMAWSNLAGFYWKAGHTGEAITIQEQVAADALRLLGAEHPYTLTAQANLATSYSQAGRADEAITMLEQVAVDRARLLGPEHPDTLMARANLAGAYWQAGRTGEAITLEKEVAADRARVLGPDHPDTLMARANLAGSYWQARRAEEAITLLEQVAAEQVRLLGPDHPDTLMSRANLATSYWQVGRFSEAIAMLEQVAPGRARVLGPDHPDTLTAQANLGLAYGQTGRMPEAITMLEQVAAEQVRLLGPDHPHTIAIATVLRRWSGATDTADPHL
jgi:tetratricopeptide (TPR) repeat protein